MFKRPDLECLTVPLEMWQKCISILQDELPSEQFNTWLRPLKVMADQDEICLLAPNRFVLDWVKDKYLPRIEEIMDELSNGEAPPIALGVRNAKPSFGMRYRKSRVVESRNVIKDSEKDELDQQALICQVKHKASLLSVSKIKMGSSPRESEVAVKRSAESDSNNSLYSCTSELSGNGPHNLDLMIDSKNTKMKLNSAPVDSHETHSDKVGSLSPHGLDKEDPSRESITELVNSTTASQYHASSISLGNQVASEDIRAVRGLTSDDATHDRGDDAVLNFGRHKSAVASLSITPGNNEVLQKGNVSVFEAASSTAQSKKIRSGVSLKNASGRSVDVEGGIRHNSSLNSSFTFESFVEGKSNQLALAAAGQVAESPGSAYNPLFLYGGVGLGKTHLMHAVGNNLQHLGESMRVVYLHSERFVADMVKALQLNAINDFKRYYRSVDALLIDDIQFFAGKERSQEEFFHTFNALLEGEQQMILTCDRYPKEINGLEERLKSRFGWGLTVAVEPPELETRVAILMKKANKAGVELPQESAFFIAHRIRSNVRELEGALKRVIANAHFMGRKIDVDLIKDSLKDLLALQEKQVSIDNIQKTVADYYKIKVADILSKRRSRSVARPRQIAMALSKELTSHSLPEIGDAFGKRDHTTVLHACRKVKQLIVADREIEDDYKNIFRSLTD